MRHGVYIRSLSLCSRGLSRAARALRRCPPGHPHTHSFQNRHIESPLSSDARGLCVLQSRLSHLAVTREPCRVPCDTRSRARLSWLYLPSVYGRQQDVTRHSTQSNKRGHLSARADASPTAHPRRPSSARPQAARAPSVTPSAPGGALNAPPPLVLIAGARR